MRVNRLTQETIQSANPTTSSARRTRPCGLRRTREPPSACSRLCSLTSTPMPLESRNDTPPRSTITSPVQGESIELRALPYVATPEVLAYDGIDSSTIGPKTDVITSRTDLAGLELNGGNRKSLPRPQIQRLDLPTGRSEANPLLTERAVERLGLEQVPAAWILRTPRPLTTTQIDGARKSAAAAGLVIETRTTHQSLVQLANDATAAGTTASSATDTGRPTSDAHWPRTRRSTRPATAIAK